MKKRTIITALTAVLTGITAAGTPLAAALPTAIVAEAANEQTCSAGGFEYSYVPGSDTAKVTKYTGTDTNLIIPPWVLTPEGWKTVTEIGSYFVHDTTVAPGSRYPSLRPLVSLTSVIIPAAVTRIDDNAFWNCTTLQNVGFCSDLLYIGARAFAKCSGITQLYFPSSFLSVDLEAFCECEGLTSLEIRGVCSLMGGSFSDCISLNSVQLNANCHASDGAFNGCTSLDTINGVCPWNKSAYTNYHAEPRFTTNQTIRSIYLNCFSDSSRVKFNDDYCTALCDYVVSTETKPWMKDALKARQLFQWVCDHCHFEPNNANFHKFENQDYSSVFLSYGLYGEGESVCAGYSKAYSMLLSAAGIESYLVRSDLNALGIANNDVEYWGGTGHMWNMVKIGGKYYQCDVSNADTSGRGFECFLLSDQKMLTDIHNNWYKPTKVADHCAHPYLTYDEAAGRAALSQCTTTYTDTNHDGIRDNDYNLNGSYTTADLTYVAATAPFFNNGFVLNNNSLSIFLNYLVAANLSPADVRNLAVNGYHII